MATEPDPERLKDEYFFTASQYYVAGRFAFWTGLPGICGNLLHHAVEMFLKGHLWLTVTADDLKKLEHRLPGIWQRFKETSDDTRLTAFDRTIENVHAFEALRYPDIVIDKGMLFHITLTRKELDWCRAVDQVPGQPPRYLLALEEVDQLVLLLFEICSRNADVFLRGRLPNPELEKYLSRANSAWPKRK